MKTCIAAITLAMFTTMASAQLKGSGKTITKNFDYKHFDKVAFQDLDGQLEIEIGKPFSIQISIPENLEKLLSVFENPEELQLKIRLLDNENNRKYIEDSDIKIRITMPEASVIQNEGNANLAVRNIVGRYFRIENKGNGDAKITGSTDNLDLQKYGNGDLIADHLIAKKATVTSVGNGNVVVNVTGLLHADLNGNGSIENKGAAKFGADSTKSGNGKFIKS